MNCPQMSRVVSTVGGETYLFEVACFPECAWWDEETGTCCFLSLNEELRDIRLTLKDIGNIMPHAGQFLK